MTTKTNFLQLSGIFLSGLFSFCFFSQGYDFSKINLSLTKTLNVDSLGAGQGISIQKNKAFIYGDREVGMIREYVINNDSIHYSGNEIKLSIDNKDVINHPTGIALHENLPTFIGNSIRLNPEGTLWKAVIYHVDWEGLQKTHSLDNNLLNTIEDDACIQGTRPEYVKYKGKWVVATADYGNLKNEVRIYNPLALKTAKKTSQKGVLLKKFTCSPWVQNLHWIPQNKVLVLIQNQIQGRRWRFTFLDFEKSLETGHEVVLKTIDIDKADELEGFVLTQDFKKGIAVTSSRKENVHFMKVDW